MATTLANSTFLDYAGYGLTNASTVEEAYGISDGKPFDSTSDSFNMCIMLQRNQDPTALLSSPWASRQQQLQQLNANGSLWKTYGADPNIYNSISAQLSAAPYNLSLLTSANSNYVSSPESRTIWFTISSSEQFENLFGTQLFYSESQGLAYWNGLLSVPDGWPVTGIWIDIYTAPDPTNLAAGFQATLPKGPQSIGNSAPDDKELNLYPQQIGSSLYNFPLPGQAINTGTVGLIEPSIGTALPGDLQGTQFNQLLLSYLQNAGQTDVSSVNVQVQGISGQTSSSGERSLDVGVVAAINPNSPLVLYNGSGTVGFAQGTVFTAVQSAAWDMLNQPQVTSNSWGDDQSLAPNSPFANAYLGIFEDAALNNQTTLIALGDGGSGNQTGNGLANVENNITQPYNLIVGGTSFSSLGSALSDPTLSQSSSSAASLTALALAQDPATLWSLMQVGLSQMPSSSNPQQRFIETVWNTYFVDGTQISGYLENSTGSGGVDTSQAVPTYQQQYGITPTSVNPGGQTGRGVPDVSANAGGNLNYLVPTAAMTDTTASGGTSAASPFWASLVTQLNALFKDQNMPQLGYINDLLYTASVVFPSAFNDIQQGNNTSSYSTPGDYTTPSGKKIQPTGFGYQAAPGYDLTSGLGSPNGYQLAVGLTNIARVQLSTATPPTMLATPANLGQNVTVSGAQQTLQFQLSSGAGSAQEMELSIGNQRQTYSGPVSQAYAWTSQLAQQTLQQGFDANLVRLFDGAAQANAVQAIAQDQDQVEVDLDDGIGTVTPQINLSSAYGFVDFSNASLGASVRASRPVSVATTADNANNSQVVVRMRQNGVDSISSFFYRVDSLTGLINGLAPGQNGYAEAAKARRYSFSNGNTSLAGSGYGNYSQGLLVGVNSGDLIAMGLINNSQQQTFWGFSGANESVNSTNVTHLWNYGMNTFGFEDTYGGGDRDFNDAVVQLDYSSASGSQWLLTPPQPLA